MSPALELLLRYQDDPALQPGTEDIGPNVSSSLRDTILRGRRRGGRVVDGPHAQVLRDARMNELDQFLSLRDRMEERDREVRQGLLTPGSHRYLNYFNDLLQNRRYVGGRQQVGGRLVPPFMAGGFR